MDHVLGLRRTRHRHVPRWWPLPARTQRYRIRRFSTRRFIRRGRGVDDIHIHLHLRRNLADRSVVVSRRDLPPRSQGQGQRVGRRGLEYR